MIFQKGQRVKCISQNTCNNEKDRILHQGQIYTIRLIIDGDYLVLKEIERPHNFRAERFELTELLPEELFTL